MEPSDTTNLYASMRLDPSRRQIRLLRVLSVKPEIVCELEVGSLDADLSYNALSYVWGDPTAAYVITVNGTTVYIAKNLYEALSGIHHFLNRRNDLSGLPENEGEHSQHVKDHVVADSKSAEETYLWVDALCINQADIAEKNTSIPLMKDVYKSATLVLAWLGTGDERAVASMDQFIQTYHKIEKGTDKTWQFFSAWLEALPSYHLAQDESSWQSSPWSKLGALLRLSYWERVWIYQELVLARYFVLIYDDRSLDADTFLNVCMWIKEFVNHLDMYGVQNLIHFRWKSNLENLGGLAATGFRVAIAIASRDDMALSAEGADVDFATREIHPLDTIVNLFIQSHRFKATDPRDYVYGFLGIANLRLPVDYSSSNTPGMVYQTLVAQWILGRSTPELPVGQLTGVLWFLDYAGIGQKWVPLEATPSWVPNFAGVSQHSEIVHFIQGQVTSGGDRVNLERLWKTFRPCFDTTQSISISGPVLVCPMIFIDRVSDEGNPMSPVLAEDECISPEIWRNLWHSQRRWVLKYIQTTDVHPAHCHPACALTWVLDVNGRKPTNILEWLPVVFWMVMLLSQSDSKPPGMESKVDVAVKELRIDELVNECYNHDSTSPTSMEKAYGLLRNDSISDVAIKQFWLVWLAGRDTRAEAERKLISALSQAHEYRIGRTRQGYVGMFPPGMKEGDVVCVLKESLSPCLLRPCGEDYSFVGHCFVPGISAGEVAELVRAGKFEIETANIW